MTDRAGSESRSRLPMRSGATAARHDAVITVMVSVNLKLFSDALAHGLNQTDGITCVQCSARSGAEAVEGFQRALPDVALLDYFLPRLSGPEATEAIRATSPTAKVLVVSGIFGPHHVERALAAGVAGFLPKSLSLAQVVEAIRQAHRGRPLVYADQLARLVDELNARIREGADQRERYATLTDREVEILRHLGDGKSTVEVARSLSVSPGTIKNHLTRIFEKTGAGNRLEAIDRARKTGVIPERRL